MASRLFDHARSATLVTALLLPIALAQPTSAQCTLNQGNAVFTIEAGANGLELGSQAKLLIIGTPNEHVCFVCDVGDGPVELPGGLGTLCLSVSSSLSATVLRLPASGRAEFSFTVTAGLLSSLVCCQVVGIEPNAPSGLAISNGICFGTDECEKCVVEMGHQVSVPTPSSFPVDITTTVKDKDGNVLGSATASYDPATQLVFPVGAGPVAVIENIAVAGGELHVTSHLGAATLRDGKFEKEATVEIDIDGTIFSEELHLSCSRPVGVGVQFGQFTITKLVDCKGNGDPDNVCAGGNKPSKLTMRYTGEDCSASNNPQAGKATCSGNPMFAASVFIRASDNADPNQTGGNTWFAGTVALNGMFDIDAANANETKFASNTYVHIFDQQGGSLLQTLAVHTSCSKPLAVGNVFGALELIGFNTP